MTVFQISILIPSAYIPYFKGLFVTGIVGIQWQVCCHASPIYSSFIYHLCDKKKIRVFLSKFQYTSLKLLLDFQGYNNMGFLQGHTG